MPILHKLIQKIEEEKTLPTLVYEAIINLIPKPDNDITRNKNYETNIPHEYKCKILNERKIKTSRPSGIYSAQDFKVGLAFRNQLM